MAKLQGHYHQNINGVSYIHIHTSYGFERLDVYLGKVNGADLFWSFEPGNPKYNLILRCISNRLFYTSKDRGWEESRADHYIPLLGALQTRCDAITDLTFEPYLSYIEKAHPEYRDYIKRVLLNKSE